MGLQALFQQGRLAILRNVGTLVAPITRDQYLNGGAAVPPQLLGATLAKWFGVAASDIPLVLPNIGRFASRDLGFMA